MKFSLIIWILLVCLSGCRESDNVSPTDPASSSSSLESSKRFFPIATSVFRDGGTLEIATLDDRGGKVSVLYVVRSANEDLNGRIFDSNGFSGRDVIPMSHQDAIDLLNRLEALLVDYFGKDELLEIEARGAELEDNLMKNYKKLGGDMDLKNKITAYRVIVEIREYRKKFTP